MEGARAAIAELSLLERPHLARLVSPGLRARALLVLAEALLTEALLSPSPTAAGEASAPLLRAFQATLQAIGICSGADILQQVGLTLNEAALRLPGGFVWHIVLWEAPLLVQQQQAAGLQPLQLCGCSGDQQRRLA